MGIGIVIRDYRANIVVVLATPKEYVFSVAIAEDYALLRAVKLCDELGLNKIEFAGDEKAIVNIVNGGATNHSWLVQITDDIKLRLTVKPIWSLTYYSRRGNNLHMQLQN